MKKIFLFSITSLLVLSVVGCGKKGTVTCTHKSEESFESILFAPTTEIIIDYEGSKITKASGNYILNNNDEAKAYYNTVFEISVADDNKTDFSLQGNKILNIIDKNDVIQLATGNINETNKDKIVDGLKKAGYTCK